jgi:hypothetical protein
MREGRRRTERPREREGGRPWTARSPFLRWRCWEESKRRAPEKEKLLVDEADNGTRSETGGGEGGEEVE